MLNNFILPGHNKDYLRIYYDLAEAKQDCNKMGKDCQAIVEQRKKTYSLRSTNLVHENKLKYKYVSRASTLQTQEQGTNSEHFKWSWQPCSRSGSAVARSSKHLDQRFLTWGLRTRGVHKEISGGA